jgi:hypothetical protein
VAKGKRTQPTVTSSKSLYYSVTEMPWVDIEIAAGKQFSSEEREEIYDCVRSYFSEYERLSQAAPARRILDLRDRLIRHASAICELARTYQPRGAEIDREDRNIMDSLAVLHGSKDFTFRDEFDNTARAAGRLVACLETEPNFVVETTSKTPEVAGLNAFLTAVLVFAEARPAIGAHANNHAQNGNECKRWGIAIGPRCQGFPEILSEILQRTVSADQLRSAWPDDR